MSDEHSAEKCCLLADETVTKISSWNSETVNKAIASVIQEHKAEI